MAAATTTLRGSWRGKTASELREIGDKSLILSPILVFEHELHELNEFMERPKRERLIIDNRSSRPLYEAYEQAFNFYFEEWCEEYDTQAMTWNGFVFYMRTNKDSITIQIYDDKNK